MAAWPTGDSMMAARIGAHDWAATPLGPIDRWPAELRTAASLVIENNFPSALVWGPDLVTLYNDGFLPILGDKADTLGRSFADIWREAWDEIGPIVERAMSGQSTFIRDYRLTIDRKGAPEEAFFTFSYSPVRGADGTVLGMIDTVIETTAEVRARSTLLYSEARHRLLIESWTQAVWETNGEGVVVKDSPSWRAYTGQSVDAWLGYGWLDAIHPDDRAFAERQWREAMAAREIVDAEFRLRAPDGGWRWTNLRAAPLLDATGEIEKWVGVNIDIDARRRAEQALQESEERRDLALEATQLGTFVWHVREDRGEPDTRMLALFDQPPEGGLSLRTALATMIHPDDGVRYAAAVAEASRPGGSRQLQSDIRVRRADGSWRWLEIRARASFGAGGQPLRMAGTALDITERKLAERILSESEERQAFLLKFSDALRPLGDPIEIMATASALTGQHLGLDRCFYGEVDPASEHVYLADSYCAQGVAPFPQRIRIDDFSKEIVAIITTGATIALDDIRNEPRLIDSMQRSRFLAAKIGAFVGVPLVKGGRLVAILSAHQSSARRWTHNDIALLEEVAERTWAAVERARAEEALRQSEKRFREFGENSSDTLWIVDAETMRLEYLSPAFERIWGERRDAVMADVGRWAELVHPDDRALARAAMPRLLAGEPFVAEYRIVRPDGEIRWIRDTGFPIKVGAVVKRGGGIAQDVTDLRRSQAALRESEERLRQFGEASQDVLWVRDAETFQWEYLTPAFETIYGLDRETALRGDNFANWSDLIVPEDRARAIANLERVRDGEWRTFEYRIRRPSDGRIRWLRNTDFPMRDDSGRVARIGGVGHDITVLKGADLALAAAEQRQRVLLEGIPQLVWRAVDGGEWTWASPQWSEFTGQPEGESHGWGWLAPIHPEDRNRAREAWAEATRAGALDVEYRLCHAQERSYRWFHTRASPVRDEAGTVIEWLGTSTDIDELRRLQDVQKTLLAELQHRVRNILAVIRSMMRRSSESQESLGDYVQHLEGRLSALARTQVLLTRAVDARVDLEDLIRDELVAQVVDEDRVALSGPDVGLAPKAAEVVSLAIHELTTNAVKYGALSRDAATLTIAWEVDVRADAPWLILTWSELGVAVAGTALRRQGFGTELITRRVPYELKGKGSLDMRPGGIECRLEFPLRDRASILQTDARPATDVR